MFKRILLVLFSLLGLVGCDQVTKEIAKQNLVMGETWSYLGDTFRLILIENHGGFLSLGATLPDDFRFAAFTLMPSVFVIAVTVWLVISPNHDRLSTVALLLVVAGGIGNIIDRVLNNGGVIDFLNLGIGNLRTGIFNIADVYIVIAGFLMIAEVLPVFKNKKDSNGKGG